MCLKNKKETEKCNTLILICVSVPFAFCPGFGCVPSCVSYGVNPIGKSIPECGKRKEGSRIEQATRFLVQGAVVDAGVYSSRVVCYREYHYQDD